MQKDSLFGRWKLRLLTSNLGFAVFCMWVGLGNAADWKTYQLAGFRAYHQGDTQMAVAQFEVASNAAEDQRVSDNELAMLYKTLATAYFADNRYQRAQEALDQWDEVLARNASEAWAAEHRPFRERLARLLEEVERQVHPEDEQLARMYKVLAKAHYTDKQYQRAREIMGQWNEVLLRNPRAEWVAAHLSLHEHLRTLLDEATDQGDSETLPPSNNSPELEPISIWPAAAAPTNEVESEAPVSPVRYGIHLASYDSKRSARAGWTQLRALYPSLLKRTTLVVRRADLEESGVFYRVIAGTFDDPEQAKSMCKEFSTKSQYCAVMYLD